MKTPLAALAIVTAALGAFCGACTEVSVPTAPSSAVAVTAEGSSGDASAVAAGAFGVIVPPRWTTEAHLVGKPVLIDDSVVSFVRGPGNALQAVAWDLQTGHERWRFDASAGSDPPGVTLQVSVVHNADAWYTAFYEAIPQVSNRQKLVLVDVGTGRKIPTNVDRLYASQPSDCGSDLCFTGQLGDRMDAATYRLTPDGEVRPDRDVLIPGDGRLLSTHVYSTNGRAPTGVETLGYSAGGATVWTRPYQDVFGPQSSSDYGWTWSDHQDRGTPLLGSGSGGDPGWVTAPSYSVDQSRTRTVALDRTTGRTLWSLDAVSPCDWRFPSTSKDVVLPLCHTTGFVDVTRAPDGTLSSTQRDTSTQVVGIDASTGQQRWSVSIERLADPGERPAFDSTGTRWLVSAGGKTMVLDVSTGATQPAPPDGTYACTVKRPDLMLWWTLRQQQMSWQIGRDIAPCGRDLSPRPAFSRGALDMSTTQSNGWVVLGTPTGLQAFPTG